jgi:hypothetical protein
MPEKDLPEADKKLEDLEERIEHVRRDPQTQDALHGSFYDPDEPFAASGEEGGEGDDQAVAPPG